MIKRNFADLLLGIAAVVLIATGLTGLVTDVVSGSLIALGALILVLSALLPRVVGPVKISLRGLEVSLVAVEKRDRFGDAAEIDRLSRAVSTPQSVELPSITLTGPVSIKMHGKRPIGLQEGDSLELTFLVQSGSFEPIKFRQSVVVTP